MGFGQGLSGLNAASQELDVIGNNIANANTVGFKASTVAFADIYATSKVGLGVKVAAVNQRFTAGTISNSGNQLDLAVDGSSGLFRVQDSLGNVMYTRNGQFFQDANNYIVNAQGQRLTGFGPVGTDPTELQVPVGNIDPLATSTMTTAANLNAKAEPIYPDGNVVGTAYISSAGGASPFTQVRYRLDSTDPLVPAKILSMTDAAGAPVTLGNGTYTFSSDSGGASPSASVTVTAGSPPTVPFADVATITSKGTSSPIVAHPFKPTDPASYTHSLPVTAYDSLGNPHQLSQYFVKREGAGTDSLWDVYYTFNGDVVNPTDPHQMKFSNSGLLKEGAERTVTITNVGGAASPAADLVVSVNYTGTTSFSGDFAYNFTQNGYPTGEFSNIEIGRDGAVTAVFTNGQRQTSGYVALANFNNLNGLQPVGDNAWVETGASGQPILGRPGTNGLALIRGQAVEESNVDMSQELVKMIISQRFYQANAQTIKTQDQVLQTLITLR